MPLQPAPRKGPQHAPAPQGNKVDRGAALYHRVLDMYHEVYTYIGEIGQDVQKGGRGLSIENMTDIAFIMREIGDMLDDCRKETERRQELLCKLLAAIATRREEENTHGIYATGTPKFGVIAIPPKRGTPEYVEFMKSMGIPQAVIDMDVFRPYWKGVCALASQLATDGKKLPEGLNNTQPNFGMILRRRNDCALHHWKPDEDSKDDATE